jgi:peptide/nickel transport system permease protein
VGNPLLAPSSAHWLGTDDLGRDVFTNVVHGTRAALVVGLVAAATSLLIGMSVGLTSGYFGGYVDDVLMRVTESFQLLPRFFLALILVSIAGGSIWMIALLLGVTFWPATARVLRSQVLSLRHREYVQAAQALGAGHAYLMLRHVLPAAIAPVIVTSAAQISGAILTEAGLSFLGLGDPTIVSWGQMLNNGQRFIRTAWWLFVWPGAALAVTVLATTLVADGLVESTNAGRARGHTDAGS